MALPLGLRNNNPGNIRPSTPPWNGAVGENKGFVVFETMAYGIRALAKQLIIYQTRYGLKTVRQTISRWAPPEDHNDTNAYIRVTCEWLECNADDEFNFKDFSFLYWMVTAIGSQENGFNAFVDAVTPEDITEGVNAALA